MVITILYEHLGSDLACGKGKVVVSSLKWLTLF